MGQRYQWYKASIVSILIQNLPKSFMLRAFADTGERGVARWNDDVIMLKLIRVGELGGLMREKLCEDGVEGILVKVSWLRWWKIVLSRTFAVNEFI